MRVISWPVTCRPARHGASKNNANENIVRSHLNKLPTISTASFTSLPAHRLSGLPSRAPSGSLNVHIYQILRGRARVLSFLRAGMQKKKD